MANQLRLYGDIESQGTRAVMTLLAIAKIPHEFVKIDLLGFETRSKKFLELNPFGHIPFLMDGDFKLAESNAILLYLCEKYPQVPKALSGSTIQDRAIVNKFLSWYQNEFRPALFEPIMMRKRYLLTQEVGNFTPQGQAFAFKRIEQTARLLNKILRLSGGPYLSGKDYTVADFLVFYEYTNIHMFDISFTDLEYVKVWYSHMMTIPQVAAIMEEFSKGIEAKKEFFKGIKPPVKEKPSL